MNKLVLAAVALLLYGVACSDQPTSLANNTSPPDISAAKKTSEMNGTVPVTIPPDLAPAPFDNPCTVAVEAITFVGTLHQNLKFWDSGRFEMHMLVKVEGADAAGNVYMVNNAFHQSGTLPFSFQVQWVAVSKGSAPNFVQHVGIHLDKQGNVTKNVNSLECRG